MITGVILAGGEHRRTNGINPALLPIFDVLLIQKQVREMLLICKEIIIVTNEPRPFLRVVDESVRIISDYIKDKGPLSGLHAGLSLAQFEEVWVVGCHMPSISAKAAQLMREFKHECGLEAIVPFIGERLQPLHGIYNRSVVHVIQELLSRENPQLKLLLQEIGVAVMNEDQFESEGIKAYFINAIKTWEDYRNYLKEHLI